MLILKIASRNVFRQKRRTLLTVLTMFGGFTLSAISIGWADGTYNNIIDMFTRNRLGHIQIHGNGYLDKPSLYNQVADYKKVATTIESIEGVVAWSPRLYSVGLASVENKSAGVRIIGLDPTRESMATRFENQVVSGQTFSRTPSGEAILGKSLAKTLAAEVENEVVILSQGADGSIANDVYQVVGLVESGDAVNDQTALYLHLEEAQELLALEGKVHEIVVIVQQLDRVAALTEKITLRLDNHELSVEPWQVFAKSFYVAMTADKRGNWVMLFIINLIVAVGVLNTVLMTVLERTREYGALRAIGTSPQQVFQLVIFEVFIMAVIGIITGIVAGFLFNYLLSFQGIAIPQSITYGGMEFTHLYTEVNAHSFYIPAATVLFSALLVGTFPAVRAARIAPAQALRTH